MTRISTIALFAAGISAVISQSMFANANVVKEARAKDAAARDAAVQAPSDLLLDLDAKIYPLQAAQDSTAVGKFHSDTKKDGDGVHSISVFSDENGPQLIEQSWELHGHVVRASLEDKLLKKTHSLEVKDGKVLYKTTDLNDLSESTGDDDAADNMVVPSTIVAYMRSHSADLSNDKVVKVRMAVMDRKDSYEFGLKKVRSEKMPTGETAVVVELKPSSILVRAVVSPMYFYVNQANFELLSYEGRSSFREKDGTKFKDLVARTVYHYNTDRVKPAPGMLLTDKPCETDTNLLNPAKCAIPADPETAAPATSSSK